MTEVGTPISANTADAPSPAEKACANCGQRIPPMETGLMFQGQAVCASCLARLNPIGSESRPVVTERTGKGIKAHIVVACLLILAGLGLAGVHLSLHLARFDFSWPILLIAGVLAVGGAMYLVVARLAAWWYHG